MSEQIIEQKDEKKEKRRDAVRGFLLWLAAMSLFVNFLFVPQYFTFQKSNASLRAKNEKLEKSVENLRESYKKEKERADDAMEFARFYADYAGIVTESGDKYHKYGCHYLNYDSFWIYNIAAAEDEGYEPCSYCHSVYFSIAGE